MRFDSLSANRANKALVPPIVRQACRLDGQHQKPRPQRTPHDQVTRPSDISSILYSLFHMFCPKLIGASLFCIDGCTWFERTLGFFRESAGCNGLGRFEIKWEIYWVAEGHFGVEHSHTVSSAVEVTGGPMLKAIENRGSGTCLKFTTRSAQPIPFPLRLGTNRSPTKAAQHPTLRCSATADSPCGTD